VERLLARPEAAAAARALGVDVGGLRRAASTLSDRELSELARRASALESDPAAGLSRDVNDLLILFLVVAVLVLALKAA
jgi:hypothetical protein